jgi:hypothetical protein
MSREPIANISSQTLVRWLFLGLPATALWAIGGLGAFSLIGGLGNGSVEPGAGSTAESLATMWGVVIIFAIGGVILGMGSLFKPVPKRILACNAVLGFFSLFFSVLTG